MHVDDCPIISHAVVSGFPTLQEVNFSKAAIYNFFVTHLGCFFTDILYFFPSFVRINQIFLFFSLPIILSFKELF